MWAKEKFFLSLAAPAAALGILLLSGQTRLKGERLTVFPLQQDREIMLFLPYDHVTCPFCLEYIEELDRLFKEYPPQDKTGIVFLNRTGDSPSERALDIAAKKIRGFAQGNRLSFPFLLDSEGIFQPLGFSTATLILIDRKERTLRRYSLPQDMARLKDALGF